MSNQNIMMYEKMSVIKNIMLEYQKKHNIKQECLTNCAVFMSAIKHFAPNDKIIAVPTICVFIDKEFELPHFCVHAVVSADNGENIMDISYEIDSKTPLKNRTYMNTWNQFNKFLKEYEILTKIDVDFKCPYTNDSLDLKYMLSQFLKITDACNKLNECLSNGIDISNVADLWFNQFCYVICKIMKVDEKRYKKNFWKYAKRKLNYK